MPKEIITPETNKCPNCGSYHTRETAENKHACLGCYCEYVISA